MIAQVKINETTVFQLGKGSVCCGMRGGTMGFVGPKLLSCASNHRKNRFKAKLNNVQTFITPHSLVQTSYQRTYLYHKDLDNFLC